MDVHPFSPHRVKFNIRITHTDTNSHHILKSLSQNPYRHIQTQIQLQGHRCQSIISLIFCILLLSLQLSRTHIARCVLTQVINSLFWTPAPFALWTSFSLTQTHIFSPCFVIDKPYFCHPERLRHLGVKGCSLPLSFLPSSFTLCSSFYLPPSLPPSLSCLCMCVSVWVCESSPDSAPSLSLKCYLANQLDVGNSRWTLSSIQSMTLILLNQPIKILLSAHNHTHIYKCPTTVQLQNCSLSLYLCREPHYHNLNLQWLFINFEPVR